MAYQQKQTTRDIETCPTGFWDNLQQYLASQRDLDHEAQAAILKAMREMHQRFLDLMSLDDVERVATIIKTAGL